MKFKRLKKTRAFSLLEVLLALTIIGSISLLISQSIRVASAMLDSVRLESQSFRDQLVVEVWFRDLVDSFTRKQQMKYFPRGCDFAMHSVGTLVVESPEFYFIHGKSELKADKVAVQSLEREGKSGVLFTFLVQGRVEGEKAIVKELFIPLKKVEWEHFDRMSKEWRLITQEGQVPNVKIRVSYLSSQGKNKQKKYRVLNRN